MPENQGLLGIPPAPPQSAPPSSPGFDSGKDPFHPTFSSGSPAHADDSTGEMVTGGTWEQLSPGHFVFTPSELNLRHHPGMELPNWFIQHEPVGTMLMMPDGQMYRGTVSYDELGLGDQGAEDLEHSPESQELSPLDEELSPLDEELGTEPKGPGPDNWMNKPGNSEHKVAIPTKHY